MGKPSIFVRLAGCNLRCYWCDTSYTWLYSDSLATKVRNRLPEHLKSVELTVYNRNKETSTQPVMETLDEIHGYSGSHVVITGGEPLLQKKELYELTTELLKQDYSIEIETNGTISPEGLDADIRFNVSPKLKNSYNPKDRRYLPEVLREFVNRDSIFKFVISNQDDLNEVEQIVEEIDIPSSIIYLMPEGRTSEELKQKSKWLIPICKTRNYNYTHRLHIDLFEKKRGV